MLVSNHPVSVIAENTWAINDFYMDTMYLLKGDHSALLIDTGMGIGDLNEMIQRLTDLPVITAVTHGHPDHAGGIDQFQEVLIHSEDLPAVESITCSGRRDLVKSSAGRKNFPITFNVEENIRDWKKIPQLKYIADGQTIELGNRAVSVIWVPGHTKGSVAFLDHNTRFLFSGDACNHNLILAKPADFSQEKTFRPKEDKVAAYAATVETCLKSLEKLYRMKHEFDWNYTGHLEEIQNTPESHEMLWGCMKCCKYILNMISDEEIPEMMPFSFSVGRSRVTYLEKNRFE